MACLWYVFYKQKLLESSVRITGKVGRICNFAEDWNINRMNLICVADVLTLNEQGQPASRFLCNSFKKTLNRTHALEYRGGTHVLVVCFRLPVQGVSLTSYILVYVYLLLGWRKYCRGNNAVCWWDMVFLTHGRWWLFSVTSRAERYSQSPCCRSFAIKKVLGSVIRPDTKVSPHLSLTQRQYQKQSPVKLKCQI